jgi:hypothetical protein
LENICLFSVYTEFAGFEDVNFICHMYLTGDLNQVSVFAMTLPLHRWHWNWGYDFLFTLIFFFFKVNTLFWILPEKHNLKISSWFWVKSQLQRTLTQSLRNPNGQLSTLKSIIMFWQLFQLGTQKSKTTSCMSSKNV